MAYLESFKTHDALKLFSKSWTNPQARGTIILIHGYLEHCRRYERTARYFNDHGYNVYAYDQRGHGLSEGKACYIKRFGHYVLDLKRFLEHIEIEKKEHFYIFCHSMGGLVTLSYLLLENNIPENLKGVIFSAPFIQPSKDLAPTLQKMSHVLGLIFPWLPTLPADPNEISRDKDYVQNYASDPLIYHGRVHAGSAKQLLVQMNRIRPLYNKLILPFLIIHGTDDKMAELSGSRDLYKESQSTDKNFIELKDFKHEVINEIDKIKVLQSIANWLDERTIS